MCVKVTHVRWDKPTALPLRSSSPHCLPVGSDVSRRACFWIEWLQNRTCSVWERIDSVLEEISKWKERQKNVLETRARPHGPIINPAPIIYQKLHVISHGIIQLNTYCFNFQVFYAPRKLFHWLPTLCGGFWKCEVCLLPEGNVASIRLQLLLLNVASVVTLLT